MSPPKSVLPSLPVNLAEINFPHKVLDGLGKPTKRGIKKCFNCGVYNGTRGAVCKNKTCRVVLKDYEEKSNVDLEAVKLLTGTSRQVYSVQVRDMGPNCRGFVQLPILQSHVEDEANILPEVALCFIDSCQRSFDDSILKCHEETSSPNRLCVHINAALKSHSTATPIHFCKDVVHKLKLSEEFKEKLNSLDDEKDGPLVQRVSKNIMAVKCQVTPKQPLGYLHFSFIRGKGNNLFEKYFCSCTDFMISGLRGQCDNVYYKCVHYYACICALVSDQKYREEFGHFVNLEMPIKKNLAVTKNSTPIFLKRGRTIEKTSIPKDQKSQGISRINIISNKLIVKNTMKSQKSSDNNFMLREQKSVIKRCKRIIPKIFPIQIKVLNENGNSTNTFNSTQNVSWNFVDWLAFVTESINKTMNIENCGIINTQFFYIPEQFYECLRKRIPCNYTVTESEISCVYQIMNVLHLKDIFDTPKIKLRISKKFIHDEQKGYIDFDELVEHQETYKSCIFFLNVGQSTVDESDNTNNPFVLEWFSDVFPTSKIGQLKLQYKYGKKST